ncbi:hypothetical protein N7516_000752 [Penicillium verrucosum]|uniref:uncharacterized protein n=1 Tax=Penicillium verrucosum TaxID=60171 RepID=UPI002545BA81|nr:uncharacterized protein N7516_000752 [Penicillium verrucosum]KAJ5940584.1 hypothetical protein N7516_000752 [Penicillium verrucosum]
MDKLSDLANKVGGNKGQEYIDKGIHAVEDKIGGGKGDTQKKATDAGREQLEQTGKGLPDKFSR